MLIMLTPGSVNCFPEKDKWMSSLIFTLRVKPWYSQLNSPERLEQEKASRLNMVHDAKFESLASTPASGCSVSGYSHKNQS